MSPKGSNTSPLTFSQRFLVEMIEKLPGFEDMGCGKKFG